MKFKTTLAIWLLLLLAVPSVPLMAQRKKPKTTVAQEEALKFKLSLVESLIPQILQRKDTTFKATTVAKVAVALSKRNPERGRSLLQIALDLSDSDTDTNNDPKKRAGLRHEILLQVYKVDPVWYHKLIEQEKSSNNPYLRVINDLLRLKRPAEAADLIEHSLSKGIREGLMDSLRQLREQDAKSADRVFQQMVAKASGTLSPAEVIALAEYPKLGAGTVTLTGGLEIRDIRVDTWQELPLEAIETIFEVALKARNENRGQTFVMCKLLLPKAQAYAPKFATAFEECRNGYYSEELNKDIDDLLKEGMQLAPENFEQLLEKVSGWEDAKKKEAGLAGLAVRAVATGKFDQAKTALAKINTTTGVGKLILDWLEYASAGSSLRSDQPNFAEVEKTARKLQGDKSAALFLALAESRRTKGESEGRLDQVRIYLTEGVRLSRTIDDGKAGRFLLNAARQLVVNEDKAGQIDPVAGWEIVVEAVKFLNKHDSTKPVRLGEPVTVPGVTTIFMGYSNYAPTNLLPVDNLLNFLALDPERTIAEVNKLQDEKLLGEIYPAFATKLLE